MKRNLLFIVIGVVIVILLTVQLDRVYYERYDELDGNILVKDYKLEKIEDEEIRAYVRAVDEDAYQNAGELPLFKLTLLLENNTASAYDRVGRNVDVSYEYADDHMKYWAEEVSMQLKYEYDKMDYLFQKCIVPAYSTAEVEVFLYMDGEASSYTGDFYLDDEAIFESESLENIVE